MQTIESSPHVVYRLYDKEGILLYVGMASTIGRAMNSRISKFPWKAEIHKQETVTYSSRTEAKNMRWEAIRLEKPKYNARSLHGK